MRIILVNDFYSPFMIGGAESVVRSLAFGLQERGHTVIIITSHIQGTEQEQIVEGVQVYRIGNFPKINLSSRLASCPTPMKPSIQLVNEFENIVKNIAPDVIHFHNVWMLSPQLLYVAGYRKGVTFHDYWPFCLRRSLMRVNEKPCPKPGKLHCRLCQVVAASRLDELNILRTEHVQSDVTTALATCNFFTAPSQFAVQKISQFTGLNVRVVRNYVPRANYRREYPSKNPYVLFASRATHVKGIDLTIKAFSRKSLKDCKLRIASNISTNTNSNIEVVGWQNPDQIARFISEANCVLVPSIWPENSPMVILEALQCGTPIIASSIGGIPELIKEGVTGILIEPGNEKSLIRAVKRCWADTDIQRNAQEFGPKFIRQYFSPESVLPQLEGLYAR
jgi:glycosyltransferase involved in cell wall biosynthesis